MAEGRLIVALLWLADAYLVQRTGSRTGGGWAGFYKGMAVAFFVLALLTYIGQYDNNGAVAGLLHKLFGRWAVNRSQRRAAKVRWRINGTLYYPVPMTRAVQEKLIASIPDEGWPSPAQQAMGPMASLLGMGSALETEADPMKERQEALASLDTLYTQLATVLQDRNGDHPDVEMLGEHVSIAQAQRIVSTALSLETNS